mgnify:CR=1 FL=1
MIKSNQLTRIFSIFILTLLLISCGSNETGLEETPPRTADDVREDFSNLVINAGTNDLTIESLVNNVFWNFRIIMPEGTSESNKRPLIFSLHGAALSATPDSHKSTDCLVTPGFEELDAIIISPNSNKQFWFEPANQSQVLALVDLASSYLPVDKEKVVITGYSDGGNGSWFFAQYYPALFSASIPMASSFDTAHSGSVEKIDVPLYVIHGSEDQLFPIETTEGYVDQSILAGSSIEFVTADGLDHLDVCDYVPYLKDAAQWLVTSVWTNN